MRRVLKCAIPAYFSGMVLWIDFRNGLSMNKCFEKYTEFDCHELTPCNSQDIRTQLLKKNLLLTVLCHPAFYLWSGDSCSDLVLNICERLMCPQLTLCDWPDVNLMCPQLTLCGWPDDNIQ